MCESYKIRMGEIALKSMEEIIAVFERNGFTVREDTIQELRYILKAFIRKRSLGGRDL